MTKPIAKLRELYEQRVLRRGPDECWGWVGCVDGWGYGCTSVWESNHRSRMYRAHVISWLLNFGDVPVGLDVMHKCHNPRCSNPAHLAVGTRKENMHTSIVADRMSRKIPYRGIAQLAARRAAGETWKQLSAGYGCSLQAVRHMVLRHGA